MKTKYKKLACEQLDITLNNWRPLNRLDRPARGWIRAIREALGMSQEQLAGRLKVNRQRVSRIEQDEKQEKLTLKTLKAAADALDCDLVYCLAPRNSLEKMVRNQARRAAQQYMITSNQTMRLEQQELSDEQKNKALDNLTEEILAAMPKSLWDIQR